MSLNSYGYILLGENQHICPGSNKTEGTAPELNFAISACFFYDRGRWGLTLLVCRLLRGVPQMGEKALQPHGQNQNGP